MASYTFRRRTGSRRSYRHHRGRRTATVKRRRAYRRHKTVRAKGISIPFENVELALTDSLSSGYQFSVHEIAECKNAATSLTDRKLRSIRGVMDVTALVPAGAYLHLQWNMLLAAEASVSSSNIPEVLSDFNPLDPADIPGNSGFKGKHPLWRAWAVKRRSYMVPTGGSTQTFTERIMIKSRAVRLIRPADRLFMVMTAKASGNTVKAGYSVVGRVGMLDA